MVTSVLRSVFNGVCGGHTPFSARQDRTGSMTSPHIAFAIPVEIHPEGCRAFFGEEGSV